LADSDRTTYDPDGDSDRPALDSDRTTSETDGDGGRPTFDGGRDEKVEYLLEREVILLQLRCDRAVGDVDDDEEDEDEEDEEDDDEGKG
jgi:hypothetical protein